MRMLAVVLVLWSLPAHAAETLDEAAARALVDRWLKAQNTRDFAGYQALYAQKFDGIKRAGARTRIFDRETWLADRQKMFAKPMTVMAQGMRVEALPGMARVRFVQSFTLGKFHDEGPKELLLVLEAGKPVIAREEMLSSAVTSPLDPAALLVVPGGVLLPVGARDSWGRGAPQLLPAKGDYSAIRGVEASKLPSEVRAWVGRRINMVGGCTAAIRELALLVRADPSDEQKEIWRGKVEPAGDLIEPPRPMPAAVIASQLWTMAPVELIGVLDRKCPGVQWGTTGEKKPILGTITPARSTLLRTAVSTMRQHPAYQKIQREYEADQRSQSIWDDQRRLVRIEGAGQTLLVLTASRFDGCADFSGGLTFVFAVGEGEKLTLINDPATQPPWTVDGAADLDGDGTLELLGHEIGIGVATQLIFRLRGGRYEVTGRSSETLLGCYC